MDDDEPAKTSLIIALSIGLSCFIIALMVSVVVIRRRARKQRDLELAWRQKKKETGDVSDDESGESKRSRSTQKLWSKAPSRWKASIRQGIRRRRVLRYTSSLKAVEPSISSGRPSITTERVSVHSNLSRASSRASSHRTSRSGPVESTVPASSTSASRSAPSVSDRTSVRAPRSRESSPRRSTASPSPHIVLPSSSSPPPPPSPPLPTDVPLPPAYPHSTAESRAERRASKAPAWRPRHSQIVHDEGSRGDNIDEDDEDVPQPAYASRADESQPAYSPAPAAHVATDDKTTLARMAELASAPPSEGPSSAPTVPEWHDADAADEELAASFAYLQDPHAAGPSSSLPLPPPGESSGAGSILLARSPFPAPPEKGTRAAPAFYDYPAAFEEDVAHTEPLEEPSAPPFEEDENAVRMGPSAPPFLPPITDEDEHPAPSAPPMDLDHPPGPSAPPAPGERDVAVLFATPPLPSYRG